MSLPKALLDQGTIVSHTRVTVIQESMPAGSLISNLDPVNAIWVSASSSVSPGNGTKIGPLGSISWTEDRVRVWACVDTDVSDDVNITLSSSLSNPQNPVDVAEAIANLGIPSVYLDTLIGTFHMGPGAQLVTDEVAKYASLEVFCTAVVSRLLWVFKDETETISTFEDVWTNNTGSFSLVFQYIGRMNVKGARLQLTNGDPVNATDITLVGTNRLQPRDVDTTIGDGIPQVFTATATVGVGTSVPLNGNGATKIEGPVYCHFQVTGATVKGNFRLIYTDSTGATQVFPFIDTTAMHTNSSGNQELNFLAAIPRAGFEIDFVARASGTATMEARFISAR